MEQFIASLEVKTTTRNIYDVTGDNHVVSYARRPTGEMSSFSAPLRDTVCGHHVPPLHSHIWWAPPRNGACAQYRGAHAHTSFVRANPTVLIWCNIVAGTSRAPLYTPSFLNPVFFTALPLVTSTLRGFLHSLLLYYFHNQQLCVVQSENGPRWSTRGRKSPE